MARPVRLAGSEPMRQLILDAAETIFADMGFSTARLEDVAQAVGLKRPSIVHYFRNKQALYDAVEADIFAALQAQTRARTAIRTDAWDHLFKVIDSWLEFMVKRPTAARITQRISADLTPRLSNPVEFSEATLATMEAALREGQARGEFRAVRASHIVNIIGGAILHYVCNAGELGTERAYQPDDPAEIEEFRGLLHAAARALLRARNS